MSEHRRPMSHDEPLEPNMRCLANIPGAEGPEGSERCNTKVETPGHRFCRECRDRFDKENGALVNQFLTDLAVGLTNPPSARVGPPSQACSGAPLSDASGESPKAVRPGLPFLSSSPPVRPTSGPQEGPPARDSASEPLLSQPPGGRHLDCHAMLEALVEGLSGSIWVLAGKDCRTSADLLERAIAWLQEEEATDRRAAIRKARGERS